MRRLVLAATVYAGTMFFQVCYPEDTVAATLANYSDHAGFEGMYEYEPPSADISQIATGLPDACLVDDPTVAFGKPDPDDPDANPIWNPNQGSCDATYVMVGDGATNPEHRQFHAVIAHQGYLVLRLLSYPAWKISVNGQVLNGNHANSLPKRDDGLIAVPVPQGAITLTVDWTTTPDAVAGRWLTGISMLLAAVVWLGELRRTRSRLT